MSRFVVKLLSAVVLGGCLVVAVAAQAGLWNLGMTEGRARDEIVGSLSSGYVPVYAAAKAFLAAPPATRAALVKAAMTWARTYVASPAFRAQYQKAREADAPEPPAAKESVDDELAAERAKRRKQIDEMKANLAQMDPETRKQMAKVVEQVEAQFAQMDKDPKMGAMMRQGVEMQRADAVRTYEERKAAHEKRFPADPNVLIARRLREALEMSKDVDFGARLVPGPGGKQVFANPAYEAKPSEWKLCYRAGEPAVQAAREAAQAWLQAIEGR
jgi:hypothetical protein